MEKVALAERIALRVNTEREKQDNMPVYRLAHRAGMNLDSVQRLCQGKSVQLSVWMLLHVAAALGTTLDKLALEGKKDE